MKPLFLIGYMGCGKSTLGRRLARRLGAEFADTDALIERREGASVADVFRYEGEERFREVEREVLEQTLAGTAAVVSTGGGLPVWRDNMARMNAAGFTVYLRREAEQIARRLSPYGRQKRPRLRGLDDAELVEFMSRDMAAREPFYAQAQLIVDCGELSDDEVVRVKEIEFAPLTEEEALVQIDLLGHDFFAYTDRDTNLVNVLYRRDNGGYGLLKQKE